MIFACRFEERTTYKWWTFRSCFIFLGPPSRLWWLQVMRETKERKSGRNWYWDKLLLLITSKNGRKYDVLFFSPNWCTKKVWSKHELTRHRIQQQVASKSFPSIKSDESMILFQKIRCSSFSNAIPWSAQKVLANALILSVCMLDAFIQYSSPYHSHLSHFSIKRL